MSLHQFEQFKLKLGERNPLEVHVGDERASLGRQPLSMTRGLDVRILSKDCASSTS